MGAGINAYRIKEYAAENVLLIKCSNYSQAQVWVLTERGVFKDHKCAMCETPILKGKDKAFRPLTNQGNRMDRICKNCGEPKLPASKKK